MSATQPRRGRPPVEFPSGWWKCLGCRTMRPPDMKNGNKRTCTQCVIKRHRLYISMNEEQVIKHRQHSLNYYRSKRDRAYDTLRIFMELPYYNDYNPTLVLQEAVNQQ